MIFQNIFTKAIEPKKVLLLVLFLVSTLYIRAQVPAAERQALIDLYNATNGANWTNNTNWNTAAPVTDWYGVTVINNQVERLLLINNGMVGSLPQSIGTLANLRELNLSQNQLSGNLPVELGDLQNLTLLNLQTNSFTGTIPTSLGNLLILDQLWLYNNNLTGVIPIELGNLGNLRSLQMSNNQLSGSIPAELGQLANLSTLILGKNQLSGPIPIQLGQLSSLTHLSMDSNQLSGNIPGELGQLTNLGALNLGNNQLTGSIPSELSQLSNLSGIWLFSNQLSGPIPSFFGQLLNLDSMYLSNNQFTGTIPVELGQLTKLVALSLSGNQLTGNIPTGFDQLVNLQILTLSGNQLTDNIPSGMGQLSKIRRISLGSNMLSGVIPFSLVNSPSLTHLDFPNNQFVFSDFETEHLTFQANLTSNTFSPQAKVDQIETLSVANSGSITLSSNDLTSANNSYQWYKDGTAILGATNKDYVINSATASDAGVYHFTATNSVVTGLTLTRNDITLTVDADACGVSASEKQALLDLYNSTAGNNWTNTLANNQPWDTNIPVCDWYGVTVVDGKVTQLKLDRNQLTGTLNESIGDLINLTYLELAHNNIQGSIPISIGNLANINTIFMEVNQFTGGVPSSIGNLSNLSWLKLGSNNLTDPIPPEIGNLSNLTRLNLNQNQIGGTLPVELGNLSKLTFLYLLDNRITGNIPVELGNLTNLRYFWLGGNLLTGIIPSELGNLVNAIDFHLDRNQLTGSIPVELGNLTKLDRIRLDENNLTGGIPGEFGNFSIIRTIYLNGNSLSGLVPGTLINLSNLASLRINDNDLSGALPNFTNQSLNDFRFENNTFVFSNFESEHIVYEGNIGTYLYTPQAKVDQIESQSVAEGGSITFTSVDLTSTNNSYQWYKDGTAIPGATSKDYVINSATPLDAGVYHFTSTNSIVTGLTLTRNDITLTVNGDTCGVSASEKQALLDLYNSTGGDNWTNTLANNQPWDTNIPVCDWFGVTVVDGKVVKVELRINGLSGNLTATIANLINLEEFILTGNAISGEIPQEIGTLPNLMTITFDSNQLSGNLPIQLSQLTSLQFLNLAQNNITGPIPVELGQLPVLQRIQLQNNSLSGAIPAEIGSINSLTHLSLYNNQLSGNLPPELGSLTNLVLMVVDQNELTGNIPPEYGLLINMTQFTLGLNSLSGQLPAELGQLSSLRIFSVWGNSFSGVIPPGLKNLPNFDSFYFEENNFVFSNIEPDFTELQSILTNIRYSPQAKVDQIESQSVAEGGSITLTSNDLTSPNNSYQWYKDGTAILGATNKDYVINSATTSDAGVYHFTSTNSIVTGLTLTRNDITLAVNTDACGVSAAEKQALLDLYNATDGANWTNTLANNQPWDTNIPVCDWFGVTVVDGKVTELNLGANNLVGPLPLSMGELINLELLYLQQNSLNGNIPSTLGQLANVRKILMYQNQFIGSIPSELGSLSNLEDIALYFNQLTGGLPTSLGQLTNLLQLNLHHNQLSGTIPLELGQLTNLQGLHLDNNNFSGTIPVELDQLVNLTTLGLSENQLTGGIPPTFSGMTKLTTIYLDKNQLSGPIPSAFSTFTNLRILFFENNEFVFSDWESEHLSYQSNLSLFRYSPQAKVDEIETLSVAQGGTITLTSNDLTSSNNSYQWYKDGTAILGAINKDYIISNASSADEGIYYFTSTNSVVTGLTLTRNDITLSVSGGTGGTECDVLSDTDTDGTFQNCETVASTGNSGPNANVSCSNWNNLGSVDTWLLPANPIFSGMSDNWIASPDGGVFAAAVAKNSGNTNVQESLVVSLSNLTAGSTYNVQFYQANGTTVNGAIASANSNGLWTVNFGGTVLQSTPTPTETVPQWNLVTLSFTATGTSQNIQFTADVDASNQYNYVYMLIDGIKVLEVGSNCGGQDLVQNFCTSDGVPTVADLIPVDTSGPAIWFTTETGGSPLAPSTPLTDGVYWQDIDGAQGLLNRIAVTVTVDEDKPVGDEIQYFDFTTAPNLTDVQVMPSQQMYGLVLWFTSPSGGLPISNQTLLVEGTTYYAQDEDGTCRLPVTVRSITDDCEVHFNFNFKFPAIAGLQPSDRINVADGVITFVNNTITDSLFITTYDDASIGARHYTLQTDLTNTYPDAYVNASNEIQGGFFRIQNDYYFNTFSKIADKIVGETRIDKTIDISFFIFSHDRFPDFATAKASYDALLNSKADKIYFVVLDDGYFTNTSTNLNSTPQGFIRELKGSVPIEYGETNSVLNSDYISFSRQEIASTNFKFQFAEFLQRAYDEIKGTGCSDGDCEDPLNEVANGGFERAIKVVTDGRNESLGSNGWTVGTGTPDTFLPPVTNTTDPYLLYTFTNSPNGGICAGALRVGGTTESFYADVPGLVTGKTYIVEFYQSNATNLMLPEFLDESSGYWKVGFGTQEMSSNQMEPMPETPSWERAKLEFIASTSTQRLNFEVGSTANDPNLAYPVYMLIDGIRVYEKPLKDEFACSDIDVQFFCSSEADITIADLVSPLPGATLWFSQQTGGVQYASGDLLEDLGTNFVWADDGSGDPRVAVEIVLDAGAPEGEEYQEFDLTTNPTVGDIVVTGSSIVWYSSATSTTPLALTTPLVSNQAYYAANGIGDCRLAVEVYVGVLPPDGNGFQEFCSSNNPTVADLEMDFVNPDYTLSWYSDLVGGTLYSEDQPLVDGTTYYAELSFGTNTTEERFPVLVSVVDVDFLANIYEYDVVVPEFTTIADLSEFYQLSEEIVWYNAPSGGTAYSDVYEVIDGETYYALIGEGICEALEVLAVTVSIQEVEEVELITCIKFVPTPGDRYMISGWVREDALEVASSETRNFEEVSDAFVDLLEYLKDKVLANEELPDVYVPKLDPDAPNVDAVVPYIKNSTSKNLTVYNFEREMESSEGVMRTVGFSFSLDPDNQYRFTYITPNVRYKVIVLGITLFTITRDYHYPMLNNPTIEIDFKDVSVCGSNFCITSDFSIEGDDQALWADLDDQLSEGSSLSGIESSVEFFTYQANPEYQVMDYLNASIQLTYKDIDGEVMALDEEFVVFRPKGAIIDGWQRISSDFTIPVDAANITITLKNTGENINAYFDDVRVHPFDANTKSFAYDPITQRLLGELDENNYATFYEYDNEGGLVRVKKETERGVYTIQETRSGNAKKTN